jgi:hypothetical protein
MRPRRKARRPIGQALEPLLQPRHVAGSRQVGIDLGRQTPHPRLDAPQPLFKLGHAPVQNSLAERRLAELLGQPRLRLALALHEQRDRLDEQGVFLVVHDRLTVPPNMRRRSSVVA